MPEFSQNNRSIYNSGFYIQDLGTAEFYGLEFIDTFEDKIIPNQNLVSTPSILIEGSTIILDYSDIQNNIDKNFINTLFTSMNSSGGTFSSGFTISGAIYNDPIRQYSADLSASCTLNSYSDYKILGTFSRIGSTIETNLYQSNFFETIPQISSSAGLTSGITTNAVINYPTSTDTSFVGNQIQIGDYIDFNTSSNVGRFTISGITVDSLSRLVDGVNIITIDSEIEKSLVLNRGIQYVFAVNNYTSLSFQFLNSDQSSGYSDGGSYNIIDNTMKTQYVFFTPNSRTPNQLYYHSSLSSTTGLGGIKVIGNYDYN